MLTVARRAHGGCTYAYWEKAGFRDEWERTEALLAEAITTAGGACQAPSACAGDGGGARPGCAPNAPLAARLSKSLSSGRVSLSHRFGLGLFICSPLHLGFELVLSHFKLGLIGVGPAWRDRAPPIAPA
jgi:hypothetical protein